jgi:tetratricopeptide repeat protein
VYQSQVRYEEALEHHKQNLTIWRKVGDPEGEAITLTNMGVVYQAKKEYTEAQPLFEAAAALINSLRQGAGASLARSSFVNQFADVYSVLVFNTLRVGLFEKAFVMSERGRARTFLDELTSGAVTLSDNIADQLLQQEQALFAQRRAIDDELARLRASPGVNTQCLEDLEVQHAKIQEDDDATLVRLRSVNKDLAALASGESLAVKEVQALLSPDMTLLAYFMLDDATIAALLLTRAALEVVELSVDHAALTDNIRSLSSRTSIRRTHQR